MGQPTRWATAHDAAHSQWYIERFRRMASEGADLEGEARLIDAIVPPHSRILDAGCGPGRVGAALFSRGHDIVGVDADPLLIDAARADHPGPVWLVADLADLDLAALGQPAPFDAAVLAGNVMPYLAPGSGGQVLAHIGTHLTPEGAVVAGFGLDRGYSLEDLDADASGAGLALEQRFATWDLRPWHGAEMFAVSIFRRSR